MRLAAVFLFIIGCPSLALAQAKLDVRWEKNGFIRVSEGRKVSRIDLSQDISGCIGVLFDRTVNERYGSGLHQMHVLDVTSGDGQHFVLVAAVAAPNCNVQGMCGAGDDDVTLIWLGIRGDLTLLRKQVFVVEDCREARAVQGLRNDWKSNLKLTSGSLTLNFTELADDPATDKLLELSGQAIYNRESASDGIRITRVTK